MTITGSTELISARDAIDRREWSRAYSSYLAARVEATLTSDDLFSLGDAAWWLGHLDDSIDAFDKAFQLFLKEDRPRPAAVCALYIGYTLSLRSQMAAAMAWISRAYKILESEPECAEHGLLLYVEFEQASDSGDLAAASELATRLNVLAERFGGPDLTALAAVSVGKLMVLEGQVEQGFRLLDQAMLAAITDGIDPSWAGNIYCNVMILCIGILDVDRAVEWTRATLRWCDDQDAAGPFIGICQSHRAQVLQMQGELDACENAIRRVLADPRAFDLRSIAEAHYQHGEFLRLKGALDHADHAYQQATLVGRDPQPGCSLLLLARGQHRQAKISIESALTDASPNLPDRALLLVAAVEIAIAAGDLTMAASAEEELLEIANRFQTPGLRALHLEARGRYCLAAGDLHASIRAFQEACSIWLRSNLVIGAAKCRLLMAMALKGSGQDVIAERELLAARSVFESLGLPCPALNGTVASGSSSLPGGLTDREVEVLSLVAAGFSNRDVGEQLFISPRTVARHLENIFFKIGVSSRTAAAAFAIEHGLTNRGDG